MDVLLQKAKAFPNSPGVYTFWAKGKIVYIGKSKQLRSRVLSYFRPHHTRKKLYQMMEFVDNITHQTCDTHLEACLLEWAEIKKHQPIYNAQYKQEKAPWYLRVHNGALVPHAQNGAGPFAGRRFLDMLTQAMRYLYPLTRAHGQWTWNYHPIPLRLTEDEQQHTGDVLTAILHDEDALVTFIHALQDAMQSAASTLHFERAQAYKQLAAQWQYVHHTLWERPRILQQSCILHTEGYAFLITCGHIQKKVKSYDHAQLLEYWQSTTWDALPPLPFSQGQIIYHEMTNPKNTIHTLTERKNND